MHNKQQIRCQICIKVLERKNLRVLCCNIGTDEMASKNSLQIAELCSSASNPFQTWREPSIFYSLHWKDTQENKIFNVIFLIARGHWRMQKDGDCLYSISRKKLTHLNIKFEGSICMKNIALQMSFRRKLLP